MSTKSESISPVMPASQRLAIYAGLTTIFSDEQANAALEKWSSYFAEGGSVFNGVNNFAKDICKIYNKDDKQRELVRALNRALIHKDNLVKDANISSPTTTSKVNAANKEVPANVELAETVEPALFIEQPISTPDFQTFELLLMKIMKLVEAQNKDISLGLVPFLSELIESMPWSETQQQQMTILISAGETTQMRAYKADQLKSFLKHLRSWVADELGSKDADRIVKQAVKETETTPAGIRYSPRNFI